MYILSGRRLQIMAQKRKWDMTPKEKGIFDNLWNQAIKLLDYRNHQQGYRGIERYRYGVKGFCKHLAIKYRCRNFRNLQDKHLISFIEESVNAGIDVTTLKTDLSSIRKIHDLTPRTRYKLSDDNDLIGVERRAKKEVDRAWTNNEWNEAVKLAEFMGRNDVVWALLLARTCGVRLEEGTALTKTQLREALGQSFLSLKNTKNNILRDITLNSQAKQVISRILKEASSERIFIYHGRNHQQAKKSIQNWITNNRLKFADPVHPEQYHMDYKNNDFIIRTNLTYHGLRHLFARDKYKELINKGFSSQSSRKLVAELLGHGRDYVTLIYLGPGTK